MAREGCGVQIPGTVEAEDYFERVSGLKGGDVIQLPSFQVAGGQIVSPIESEYVGGEESGEATIVLAVVIVGAIGHVIHIILRVNAARVVNAPGESIGGLRAESM